MSDKQKNVLGEDLEECSNDPLTGWYRDGCCSTDENDHGVHTVCAKVTTEFLEWCKEAGNDLITPHPEFGFPGLKAGDGWCVCASWYARAVDAGKGCPIYLKRTHEKTLKLVSMENLKKHAIDLHKIEYNSYLLFLILLFLIKIIYTNLNNYVMEIVTKIAPIVLAIIMLGLDLAFH